MLGTATRAGLLDERKAGSRAWPVETRPGDLVRVFLGERWRGTFAITEAGTWQALPSPRWEISGGSYPAGAEAWSTVQRDWPDAWERCGEPGWMLVALKGLLPNERLVAAMAVAVQAAAGAWPSRAQAAQEGLALAGRFALGLAIAEPTFKAALEAIAVLRGRWIVEARANPHDLVRYAAAASTAAVEGLLEVVDRMTLGQDWNYAVPMALGRAAGALAPRWGIGSRDLAGFADVTDPALLAVPPAEGEVARRFLADLVRREIPTAEVVAALLARRRGGVRR